MCTSELAAANKKMLEIRTVNLLCFRTGGKALCTEAGEGLEGTLFSQQEVEWTLPTQLPATRS